MRNHSELLKDGILSIIGVVLGEGLLSAGSRGMSKDKKIEIRASNIITSILSAFTDIETISIFRRVL